MPKRLYILLSFLLLLLLPATGFAQQGPRLAVILLDRDTLRIDSLSTVPGTFSLTWNDIVLEEGLHYHFDPYTSTLSILAGAKDSLLESGSMAYISYRAMPLDLSREYYLRRMPPPGSDQGFAIPSSSLDPPPLTSTIQRQGSLSRMITAGNNQNASLHSDLDLQLSGALNEKYTLRAALSDQNIPLQPEGTTTTLKEFDRMFIEVEGGGLTILAGDMVMKASPSPYLKMTRKVQGLMGSYHFEPAEGSFREVSVKGSMALSKGKYARNKIQGIEGNQGPYRLRGSNAESFIVVLSGSEKVYIDGKLLTRGSDRDYVIDYNLAQLSFMPTQRITANSRIIIEFEYSEQSYARSLLMTEVRGSTAGMDLALQVFSESDMKNQNFQQPLDAGEKALLASVGDSLWNAVVPRIDTVAFNGDEVLYKQVDTLVLGTLYTDVFVHSTDPDLAKYRLGFSNVGPGNGNYIRIQSAANGKVYQWVAPGVNGVPSGEYEPVSLLAAPGKKQLVSLDGAFRLGKGTRLITNISISNTDINTFSSLDAEDNTGTALLAGLENKRVAGSDSSWAIRSGVRYQRISGGFRSFEQFRDAEFERDWNLPLQLSPDGDQQWEAFASAQRGDTNLLNYRYSGLNRVDYTGHRHALSLKAGSRKLMASYDGSYLLTGGALSDSKFYRHSGGLRYTRGTMSLDIRNQVESNRRYANDSLGTGSASFVQTDFRLIRKGSKGEASVAWITRDNLVPEADLMKRYSHSDDIELTVLSGKRESGALDLRFAWRQVSYDDSSGSAASDRHLLARLNGNLSLARGVVTARGSYETSSGVELRKEYSYLRVADGQGLFAWSDYNNDSIKQLDEFEVAVFSDQANYLRIFIPTNDYIRVFINSLSADLSIRTPAEWRKSKGLRRFMSRFYLESRGSFNTRNTGIQDIGRYNPFPGAEPSSELSGYSSQLRNRLYFNRGKPGFSFDLGSNSQRNMHLLSNGFETQGTDVYELKSRVRLSKSFSVQVRAERRFRESQSEFFASRSYALSGWQAEPRLDYQPGRIFRISLFYRYATTSRIGGMEESFIHDSGLEARYSFPGKGMAQAKISRSAVSFNGVSASPLGWEMLGSLLPGINYTWSVGFQRNLKENLQMNLLYDGRSLPGKGVIHTGTVQVDRKSVV